MNDENENGRNSGGRAPLTLKPRPGAMSSGTVKQSFSHGRSKTVVVETKRRRVDAPVGNLAAPSPAEKRAVFDVKPAAPVAPRAPAAPSAASNLGLSSEELRARQRVVEAARADQERLAAERARETARLAQEEARRREAEAPAPRRKAAGPPRRSPSRAQAGRAGGSGRSTAAATR